MRQTDILEGKIKLLLSLLLQHTPANSLYQNQCKQNKQTKS